jgi:predicted nuclease of predicted toxin-antitoxin system
MYRLKLDENFSPKMCERFTVAGHDAHSVVGEKLSGAADTDIYQVILAENRCLITFDLDFCNILRFPSEPTKGIIVVRPNRPITLQSIELIAKQIIKLLEEKDPANSLWVLEPGKLRIRRPN